MSITVLDPTNEPIKTAFEMARRPESLKGLVLGLIDNGKKNSDYLVRKIANRLEELHGLKGGMKVKKPSPSHAVPEECRKGTGGEVGPGAGRYRRLRFLQLGQCARRNRHGKTGSSHGSHLHGTVHLFGKGHGSGPWSSRLPICRYPSSHQRHLL